MYDEKVKASLNCSHVVAMRHTITLFREKCAR